MTALINSFFPGSEALASNAGFDFVRPKDGAVVGRIVEAGADGVDKAVAASDAAFRLLRKSPVHARIALLRQAAAALRQHAEELALIISEDVGKPIRAARFEAQRGVEFIEACAAAVSQMGGEILPLDAAANGTGLLGLARHVPYGVVAAITPFNAPINLQMQS